MDYFDVYRVVAALLFVPGVLLTVWGYSGGFSDWIFYFRNSFDYTQKNPSRFVPSSLGSLMPNRARLIGFWHFVTSIGMLFVLLAGVLYFFQLINSHKFILYIVNFILLLAFNLLLLIHDPDFALGSLAFRDGGIEVWWRRYRWKLIQYGLPQFAFILAFLLITTW
jgi:hypothetical protein